MACRQRGETKRDAGELSRPQTAVRDVGTVAFKLDRVGGHVDGVVDEGQRAGRRLRRRCPAGVGGDGELVAAHVLLDRLEMDRWHGERDEYRLHARDRQSAPSGSPGHEAADLHAERLPVLAVDRRT